MLTISSTTLTLLVSTMPCETWPRPAEPGAPCCGVPEAALSASEARLRDLVEGIDAIVTIEDELTGEEAVVLRFEERLREIGLLKEGQGKA